MVFRSAYLIVAVSVSAALCLHLAQAISSESSSGQAILAVSSAPFDASESQLGPTTEGFIEWEGHKTWYKVTGKLTSGVGPLPLVTAHGGPGCTHDYIDRYKFLSRDGRAVIHYDQIGNGKSDHLPSAPPSFWTPALFLRELDALLTQLTVKDSYIMIGQSWGAMLALMHAITRPKGLVAIVSSDGLASMSQWVVEADRMRAELPEDIRNTLLKYEATGEYSNPEYKAASAVFYAQHVCRVVPNPPDVVRTNEWMEIDPTVYEAMWGPTEFKVTGSLSDWEIVDQLKSIEVPTLICSGKYDEASPAIQTTIHNEIKGSEWVLFENSSHLPHVEETERYMEVVGAFLRKVEAPVLASRGVA